MIASKGLSKVVVKPLAAFCSITGAVLFGWLLYYILGPEIDNRLHVKTSRDLKILRMYPVGGATIGSRVAEKYVVESWAVYHEDWVFATRVDCHVLSRSGQSLLLSWEVRHRNPPRAWMPKRDLYVTPLTRSAAELAPELLPSGVLPKDLPLSKYGAGFVYDIARDKIAN